MFIVGWVEGGGGGQEEQAVERWSVSARSRRECVRVCNTYREGKRVMEVGRETSRHTHTHTIQGGKGRLARQSVRREKSTNG